MTHVCFDIGNVLCQFNMAIFTKKLSEVTGVNDHDAWFFLKHMQNMQDIGVTTVAESLEYKYTLKSSDIDLLMDAWNATLTPSELMLTFMDKLRSEGVKIALLSNMGAEHTEYLRKTCTRMFDNTIQHMSCEVGARKPSKLFYQSFLLDNDRFTGCVYLDDVEANLKTGKHFSFKAYRFVLDDVLKMSLSQQKQELDRIKQMIFNKN